MKFLKIFFVTLLVVVLIAIVGIFVFIKSFDINAYKDQITEQVSKTLNRPVEIENLALNISFESGVNLKAQNIRIRDDAGFDNEHIVKVKSVLFNLDLKALVSQRSIVVSQVDVVAPVIKIIKNKGGEMNVLKLAEGINKNKSIPDGSSDDSASSQSAPVSAVPSKSGSVALLVKSIRLREGEVIYIDESASPVIKLPVQEISVLVDNFSLTQPFKFDLAANVLSDRQNISARGEAALDVNQGQVVIRDLSAQSDLSQIVLSKLENAFPAAKGQLQELKGQLKMTIEQLTSSSDGGLPHFMGKGQLEDGFVKIPSLTAAIAPITAKFQFTEAYFNCSELNVPIGSGAIKLSARLNDYLASRKFSYNFKINDIPLNAVIPQGSVPVEVQGNLLGSFEGQGDLADPAKALAALVGTGSVEVKDGLLVDFNVLELVLKQLSMIPNIAEKLEAQLPPEYKEKLKQKNTALKNVIFETDMLNGSMIIKKAAVEADGFIVSAKGEIDLNQNLKLSSEFFIEEKLSAALVASVEELGALLDQNQRIYIPLTPYDGPAAKIKVFPDMQYLGTKIIKSKGKEELKKVIFDAIGIEQKAPVEGNPSQPSEGSQPVRPEEEIINGVLDAIFK